MTDIALGDEYPADAVGRACFLTGMARGEVWVETADGKVARPEKVLITDRDVLYEGRVCVGERAVRHLAHRLGLVDDWRFERVAADNQALRDELVALSREIAEVRGERDRLADLERPEEVLVYLAIDGTRHASKRGAIEHTAKLLDLEPNMLELHPTIDPSPVPEVVP